MIQGFELIGEALKVWLDAQTLSKAFTVVRRNHFATSSETLQALKVFVFPISKSNVAGTRKSHEADYRLAVRVGQQIAANSEADNLTKEDELLRLVDEIEASLASKETLDVGGKTLSLTLVTEDVRIPMDWEAIREHKAFFAQIEVVVRAKS